MPMQLYDVCFRVLLVQSEILEPESGIVGRRPAIVKRRRWRRNGVRWRRRVQRCLAERGNTRGRTRRFARNSCFVVATLSLHELPGTGGSEGDGGGGGTQ
ncbi:hypothetical protein BHE74_00034807 [Ensete ventricosum]|nr:hypothetical protein GW17_00027770 [Ensete ventricosum]RWW58336.1 hypothetical protein BHE74_00034807 [Ensete ventricosum]